MTELERHDDARRDGHEDVGREAGAVPPEGVPVQPTAEQGPTSPTDLSRGSWMRAMRRTLKEFQQDNLSDWAAALTYYGVLSIFPGLLLLVSLLRFTGRNTVASVLKNLSGIAPGSVRDLLTNAAEPLQQGQQGTAGVLALVSLAAALWSASGYVGAFMRASNDIYDVPEGRPVWKTIPIRLGVTVLTGVLLSAAAVIVVFTGPLADVVGHAIGVGSSIVTLWSIAKWPVLVLIVSLLFALLYWASPNAKHGGFRWVSPGSLLAVFLWLLASAGFALYVSHFGSYNKTYGSIAAVIIFLVWLWISNLAILLGAEFDAELQRGRAIAAGHPAAEEPYLELRDTRALGEPTGRAEQSVIDAQSTR